MTGLFLKIVNMSISASWLILAVLILRLIFRKAPKWIRVLLWGIVALRLMVPFSVESTWSLLPSGEMFSEQTISGAGFDIETGITPVDHQINSYLEDHDFEGAALPSQNGTHVVAALTVIWIIGIVVLAGYTAVSLWYLRQRIDTAVVYRDHIFQSEYVKSPFVLGIIRPRIYLPFKMDGKDLENVIAHEQAHILRKDHWWKPLGFVLLTIHWFNPALWLAYLLLCRDIELACDEKVIKGLDHEQRADYTQTLLACSVNHHMRGSCPVAFGEVGVKERVKSIMNYRKPALGMMIVFVIACVVISVCFLTNPKQKDFDIKIEVPAGSEEGFVYSHEEISPIKNQIVIASGDHLGDTEVVLKPIEVKQENAYEPAYLTPGMPVKMKAEKGAWFRIGVNVQNPSDEDITVYVHVKNVEVRIQDIASSDLEQYHTKYIGDAPKVSKIAQLLPYPDGYSYSSIELQTSTEPYELMIYLDGEGAVQEKDFKSCADTAFDLIGNMGIISFYYAGSKEMIASFRRSE